MSKRANGEGSVYKRKDGRWVASITADHGKRKHFFARTRQEVGQKLAAALKAQQDGLPIVTERQTVSQYLEGWLVDARPSLRPRTWVRYEQLLRIHALPFIGKLHLAKLAPGHLQRLYASRLDVGQAPGSVRQLHAVLHKAFGQAARWGQVARNVADLVSPPRVERPEVRPLSSEQVRTLLEAARGDRLEALYVLAVTTGMRLGELRALRWGDVDLQVKSLRVTGTLQQVGGVYTIVEPKSARSRRQVALTGTAVEALGHHRAAQAEERLRLERAWEDLDLVFTNEVGGYVAEGKLRRNSFWPLLERAGLIRIRFHDLRHTAATLLLQQGVHPKIVSERLGHSTVNITLDLYSHVAPSLQVQAAAKLDRLVGR